MADVGRELNKLVALPTSTRVQGTRYWQTVNPSSALNMKDRALSCVIQVAVSSVSPSNRVTSASTPLPRAHAILNYIAPPIH